MRKNLVAGLLAMRVWPSAALLHRRLKLSRLELNFRSTVSEFLAGLFHCGIPAPLNSPGLSKIVISRVGVR